MVMVLVAALALAPPVQSARVRPYVGRPVADVLQELQTPNLRIIFSTDLVPAAMRVQAEPTSRDPKEIARQILEPHHLGLQPGPRGTLLVVVLPRVDSQPSRQRKPPAAPAQPPAPAEPQKPEPIRIEEEVNVIDRLGETTGIPSAYTVRPKEIRETAGAFENVFLAMQLLPGVVATNDEDGKLAVRGAGPEHNLIVLDGVPIHNPIRFGDFTASFLNPATASSVSLDASGLDARHGGRLSSVTVFESRDGNRSRRLGVSGSLGLTTGDVLLEGRLPGTESGSWWATARGTYYRAVFDRFNEGSVPGFGDLQAKVSLQPGKQTRLSIFALAGRETMSQLDLNDGGERYVRSEFKGINRIGIANLTWNPNTRLVTTTTPSIYWHDERQLDSEQLVGYRPFERVMRVHDLAVRQRALFAFSPRHVLDSGVELHRIGSGWRMVNFKQPDFWRGLGPTTLGELVDYSAGPIDTSLTRTHFGFWLQDRIPLGPHAALEPGVRLDWNSFTDEASWQPRLRVTLGAGGATLWAGFATQVQTPSHEGLQGLDYFHITPADGSRLRNERSQQIVAGFARGVGAGFDLRVEAYYRQFDRLLVQRLETAEEQAVRLLPYLIPPDLPPDDVILERRPTIYPESTGRGLAKGVETLLQRRTGRATGWLSYTATAVGAYQLSRRFRLSGTWQGASGLPLTPMHAEVYFGRLTRLDGTQDPFYRTSRNRDGTLAMMPGFLMRRMSLRNSERLSSYARTDVRLTYATLGHWEFYGEIINLFNQRNYLERFRLDDPRVLGGTIESVQNIHTQFERFPTFGIRATF
jgi:hypothetical protein